MNCACGRFDVSQYPEWLPPIEDGVIHSKKACGKDCEECNGEGIVTRAFAIPHDQPCDKCFGSGIIVLAGSLEAANEPNPEGPKAA